MISNAEENKNSNKKMFVAIKFPIHRRKAFQLSSYVTDTAFSKRFVGAGHSEEGGSQGGEGTLLRARRARTFKGGLGAFPLRNFLKFGYSKVPFGAVWGDLKRQNYISFAQLYLPSFSIKGPNLRLY